VNSANANGTRIAEKIAASANETFGTWTNASQVAVIVYRSGNYMHCGFQQSQAGTTDTVTFLSRYLKPDLLIIDDMGMKQLPKRSGEYLFEIIMRRTNFDRR
jgi:hypothetical protein